MNGNTKPYAILVFGVPMSGKTEFAKNFSREYKAPFLNLALIEDAPRKTILSLIKGVAISGQNIIVEGGLDTQKHREEISAIFSKAGYTPVLVWVQTDLTTIKRRIKTKFKKLDEAKTFLGSRLRELEAPADTENPVVISGKHTFSSQLTITLAGLSNLPPTK